jgi:O-antigen ligase
MLLAYAVSKKSKFFAGGVVLSLCAIGIIYSRSAYLVIILCTFAFFLVSHRAKVLPWIMAGSLIALPLIPQSIIERALTGLAGNDVNAISAGRVDQIWIPLIKEFMQHPLDLIIGTGRFAIMSTDAFKSGAILQVGHAHSMYLDTLFDAGIIGLSFFLAFFFIFTKRFIKAHKLINDKVYLDILIGIEISIAAFLIRGITDSFFFPTLTNSFLWLDLGLGIAIVYFFTQLKKDEVVQDTIVIQEAMKDTIAEENKISQEANFLLTGSVMNYETLKERDEVL